MRLFLAGIWCRNFFTWIVFDFLCGGCGGGGWLGQIGKAGTGCPFWLLLPACCVAGLILSSEMFRLWGFVGVNSLGSFCYTDLGFMTTALFLSLLQFYLLAIFAEFSLASWAIWLMSVMCCVFVCTDLPLSLLSLVGISSCRVVLWACP